MVCSVPADCIPGEEWFAQPLVQHVLARVGGPERIDPAVLLCEMHRTMTELEERFPSIPFRDVYSCPPVRRASIRKAMKAAGVSPADIELAVGKPGQGRATSAHTIGDRSLPSYTDPGIFRRVRSSESIRGLSRMLGVSHSRAEFLRSLKNALTETEQKVLGVFGEHPDWSIRGVAIHLGLSRPTVHRALGKREYQVWLSEEFPDEVGVAV